jgi:hypothetical protein
VKVDFAPPAPRHGSPSRCSPFLQDQPVRREELSAKPQTGTERNSGYGDLPVTCLCPALCRAAPEPLPMNLRLGVAAPLLDSYLVGILLAAGLYEPLINDDVWGKRVFTAWTDDPPGDEYREVDLHLGGEISLLSLLSLRVGRSWDWDGESELSHIGAGPGPETARLSIARVRGINARYDDSWIRLGLSVSLIGLRRPGDWLMLLRVAAHRSIREICPAGHCRL